MAVLQWTVDKRSKHFEPLSEVIKTVARALVSFPSDLDFVGAHITSSEIGA